MSALAPTYHRVLSPRLLHIRNDNRHGDHDAKGRLICALDTGLRAGAMRHLQNKHIDFENWVLFIPAAIQKDAEPLEIPVESERLRSFFAGGHGEGTAQERFAESEWE